MKIFPDDQLHAATNDENILVNSIFRIPAKIFTLYKNVSFCEINHICDRQANYISLEKNIVVLTVEL
ncbi:unnamed protein product [Rotaria magnacalcarata]|nr:unnamed protein product [Rotaria magnacalcarata]CAF1589513.1 unnamed protein product [Rotaria magnacalcarata]CAF2117363.1 unnamed protein product [Rotaria magnacalcarata]